MAFRSSDVGEVRSLLGKVTTTMDGIGRSKRDIRLVIKMNAEWPSGIRTKLGSMMFAMEQVLKEYDNLETQIIEELARTSVAE